MALHVLTLSGSPVASYEAREQKGSQIKVDLLCVQAADLKEGDLQSLVKDNRGA